MFFKSYLFVFLLSAFVANAAVLAERAQDAATTNSQMSKLKEIGFLDKFTFDPTNFPKLTGMNANQALSRVVASQSFQTFLKTKGDINAKSNTDKAVSTGILDKLKEWKPNTSFQTKLNKMDAKFLLIKIAQSQAFKDAYNTMKTNRQQQEAKVNSDIKKGKKPTVVKIVHKNKGKPTATVVSIKGGPAITLAAKGTPTTFAGKVYTVSPTAVGNINVNTKDNAAAAISTSFWAKFLAVAGGAFGGIMLVVL